jgi:hypothetical protein
MFGDNVGKQGYIGLNKEHNLTFQTFLILFYYRKNVFVLNTSNKAKINQNFELKR